MKMEATKEIRSVLILDDDTIQARVLSHKLLQLGYEIAAVTFTGAEAIVCAKRKQPDIVLLDINLHGQAINGIEVGNTIRKIKEDVILIYITAYASNENFKQALDSTPNAFIKKPYDMRTLDRQIELAINQVLRNKVAIKEEASNERPLPKDFRILYFSNYLKIKENNGYKDWFIKDIYYLEANGAYTNLKASHQKTTLAIGLGKIEEKLLAFPYPIMARIHHKFLVNMAHIQTLDVRPKSGGIIKMTDGRKLGVSRGYAESFWKRYMSHFGRTP